MLETTERLQFDGLFATLWSVDGSAVVPPDDRHKHSISDVGQGGVIAVGGELFAVVKTAKYQETDEDYTKDQDYNTTELVLRSLKTGDTRYIEWAVDDELEVSFVERKLTTSEARRKLKDDEGEAFDIDDDIDEVVDEGWPLMFNGRTYEYDDDWAFRYTSSDGRSLNGYMYEFGSAKDGWLTIEGWKEESGWDYEVFLSQDIVPSQVVVLAVGG